MRVFSSLVGQAVPDELRLQTVRGVFRQAQPDLLSIGVLLECLNMDQSSSVTETDVKVAVTEKLSPGVCGSRTS